MVNFLVAVSIVSIECFKLVLREVSCKCTLTACNASLKAVKLVSKLAEILSLYIESVRSSVIVEEVLSSCESLLNLVVSSDSSTVCRDLLVALLELVNLVYSFDELSNVVKLA